MGEYTLPHRVKHEAADITLHTPTPIHPSIHEDDKITHPVGHTEAHETPCDSTQAPVARTPRETKMS
jgi:hypothetical protein